MDVKQIPPLPLHRALLFFGVPLVLMTAIFWGLIPLMDLMAVKLFLTFLLALGAPRLVLLLLSLWFYRKEGHSWNKIEFRKRFRLKRMTGGDWAWALSFAAILIGTQQLLAFTNVWISEIVPEPKFLIRMMENDPNYFMEFPLKGNWFVFLGMTFFVVLKIFGEEFWWRGYTFPRQELVHGKWTWLVHGSLWWTFYLFMPWDQIQLLPGCLAVTYLAQRTHNTWTTILARLGSNLPFLVQFAMRII